MKVALYARVSMEETDEGVKRYQEPENQLAPLRKLAEAMNYEVVAEYVDRASGGDSNRPEFKRMLNDGSQIKFNGVLVWKLDRFSREGIQNTLAYIRRLKQSNIWLKSMTESWLDTKEENITELVLAVMAWASAEERRKISERTKAGIAQKRAIGQWRGGRPRVIPQIEISCEKKDDGYYCKYCNKRFKDEKTYLRKWNMHIRQFEKGGAKHDARTQGGVEIAPLNGD